MRLRDVHSIVDYGRWATSRGFRCAEGPGQFGPVAPVPVHSTTSLHYANPPRALDINHDWNTNVDAQQWSSELDALKWLYVKTLKWKRAHPRFPLDELFVAALGWVKEAPDQNTAISNHWDHLHIGFTRSTW